MTQFVLVESTPLSCEEAWRRLTDWPAHGRHVPFTRVSADNGSATALHTVVTARTALGPLGFDDPMEIVAWHPPLDGAPAGCRLEKRGRVIHGWAELSVAPQPQGCRVTWREDASPAHLPRFAQPAAAAAAKLLFGRVLRRLLAG